MELLKDENLLKISAVMSIVFFIAAFYAYTSFHTKIVSIGKNDVGRTVCIEGIISKITKLKNACMLYKIKDNTGEISAFLCSSSPAFSMLKKEITGKKVLICGKIKLYRNKIEIIPVNVRLIE